jgi:aspartate/methionine/tyrosine aminotransferase
MRYRRLPIEIESPEERGYGTIRNNLTESSVRDLSMAELGIDLGDLVLAYGDHRGDPALREQIAATTGDGVGPEHVIATPGAAGALFMVATSLLEAGDHLVVTRTNYSTNIETPRLIGAEASYLDLRFDEGFRLDLDRLRSLVRPGTTTLVSLTYPHNPTGALVTRDELEAVADLCESAGCRLLVDETYRELTHGEPLPSAATLSDRAISVCSLSKAYGLPGIRQGWAVTRDPEVLEVLLAAKEQIVICGSALDEAVAADVLARRDELLPPIRAQAAEHLAIVAAWMAEQPHVSWVPPVGGVVAFPRLADEVDPDAFSRHLNEVGGTYVGEGHWFDADRHHFRLGYGWPTTGELRDGLAAITDAAASAIIS